MRRGCTRRSFLRSALPGFWGLTVSGCALFNKPAGKLFTRALKLPPIGLPPNAIQLEITYVERPVGDARLGPQLWDGTDEISIEPQHRAVLRQNGFRAGVTGSNPPQALQQMLGLTADFAYEPEAEKAKGLVGHRYIISSGAYTTVQVSQKYSECALELPSRGDPTKRTLTDVVCKYHIKAERLQEGWVQLDFVPQIHFGDLKMRREATQDGFQLVSKQLIETFSAQQFRVRLSLGEIAIVTATDDAKGLLGDLFFRGPQALAPPSEEAADTAPSSTPRHVSDVQRVLVVRLGGMGTAPPPK